MGGEKIMDFHMNQETEMLRQNARVIAQDYGLQYWRELDAKKEWPSELWKKLGELGYIGVAIPEQYGGSGLGMLEMALIIEELASAGAGSTVSQLFMLTPVFGAITINKHGTEKQKNSFLPDIARGKIDFCMALTEPNAGTNSLSITTRAEKKGNKYIINGQKVWITGVRHADYMLLVARTTPIEHVKKKTHGISLFIVDVNDPAIRLQRIDKLGTNCLESDIVFIEDLEVNESSLIGEEGKGWYHLLDTLNAERIVTTAGCIGTGQLCLKLAVDYAKERKVFEKPIAYYQGVQFPLAKIKANLDMAQLMNYKAAWLYDHGLSAGNESNMAKMVAAEAGFSAADQAMQTMGGFGYGKEYDVERLWRDVRLFKIAPVSEEMILNFISQYELGLPRSY